MNSINDKRLARNIISGVLFLLSGVLFFTDWWSISFFVFSDGMTPIELGRSSAFIQDAAALFGNSAGSNLQPWITVALVIVWGTILHAVVCRVLNSAYRGFGVPAVVLVTVIAASIFASDLGMSLTAMPILALLFAVAGVLLAPAGNTAAKENTAGISSSNSCSNGSDSRESSGDSGRRNGIGMITGVSGLYKDASFTIADGETLVFGRDPAICHVVFDSSNISREHCTIRYHAAEDAYYVKDTSRNGTYYEDGIRMQPQRERPVAAGEKIYLNNPDEMFKLG